MYANTKDCHYKWKKHLQIMFASMHYLQLLVYEPIYFHNKKDIA